MEIPKIPPNLCGTCLRLVARDAGREARDERRAVCVTAQRFDRWRELVRREELRDATLKAGEREAEVARHHTEHGERTPVDRHTPADDRRVAGKATAPEGVAQDDYVGRRRIVFACAKRAPARRLDAKHVEDRRRDLRPNDTLWLALAGQRERRVLVDGR